MDKIAVLIPCYNEEKTVEKVVRDFKAVLPEAVIYVYDNNSSDRTVELAEKAGAVVRHEYMQGKGNVIRRMFREIDAEVYVEMIPIRQSSPERWWTRYWSIRQIWLWEIVCLPLILQRISVHSTILVILW